MLQIFPAGAVPAPVGCLVACNFLRIVAVAGSRHVLSRHHVTVRLATDFGSRIRFGLSLEVGKVLGGAAPNYHPSPQ